MAGSATMTKKTKEIATRLRGVELLENGIFNKGTAFTAEERADLGLYGLLPSEIETMETQLQRAYEAYQQKNTDLEKHIYLRALQDRNETLFYKLIQMHISEMLPIIYDPVVGEACQRFHEIYRKSRGLFISYPERDKMSQILNNIENDDIQVIVVSDGERILGLGDQGAGGMGIPIGKVSLYTACGGINPANGLPIILDVGTNNPQRLKDPLYLGWRQKRIGEKEYLEFVEQFVEAVIRRWPHVLLQWEDFAFNHAHVLLERYRNRLCTFNDDIQGTAAITYAGLLAAVKASRSTMSHQQVVIFGAGSAGTGIARQIELGMIADGLSPEEARSHIWLVDKPGLLVDKTPGLAPFQKPYAKPAIAVLKWQVSNHAQIGLLDVVKNVRPTVLIGASTAFGAFKEPIIREMAKGVPQPIIFPLSNPPSRCEAAPKDLVTWTDGHALIGTGTRYPDVNFKGKTYRIGQCNNYYIFPAMGLAVAASKATRVTDSMFLAAAEALSNVSPALQDPTEPLFPPPEKIHDIAKAVALAAALKAVEEGVAEIATEGELKERIETAFWRAEYAKIHYQK